MANDLVVRSEIIRAANSLGLSILPDKRGWTNRIQIKSESSTRLYVVAQRQSNGEWGCSCPGWIFHRNCKHLRAMLPALRPALEAPKDPMKIIGDRIIRAIGDNLTNEQIRALPVFAKGGGKFPNDRLIDELRQTINPGRSLPTGL